MNSICDPKPRALPMSDLATAEEIVAEARAGRMVVLVDDEDRENEGDIVVPASCTTPEMIAFMARQACGLVCLAIDGATAERLQLPPMVSANTETFQTAFTVSIEAREGVTTGISAQDRARTVAVAIDPASGPADVVMPGHLFPVVARDGGLGVRAGHTEAAVDLARLAGHAPAGVICEIMNEDGTMARLPDLMVFARRHDLRIGTIADLSEYCRNAASPVV
ncbi:3,4-dihydroxy-2-butanone 4-phosphate synthase [Hartmannibacter diazotrophicus]|uniref:3,4-dihydroxy-2-butanone 4-phosphate synthase n=1 Tax=Hartmannibacter diazotrophicus TaxID=1482074 RepID=A0A2C9D5T8_9HYPH|nr:3,4-dihydroxy-2-butanone 4-phosphate synthase [Hartmannibacter diazotrophicus]